MKKVSPYEQKWRDLVTDDYARAEDEDREERYWKGRIKKELERRRIKDSGSWWEKFVWGFKQGARM